MYCCNKFDTEYNKDLHDVSEEDEETKKGFEHNLFEDDDHHNLFLCVDTNLII